MKTDRLVSIILLLLEQKRVRARDLAERFEVSQRTIYRDLDSIAMSGIPIRAIPGVSGGFEIMPGCKLDKSSFTSGELSALLTGLAGMNGIIRREELSIALAKLESLIPSGQREQIRRQTERYVFDWSPWSGSAHVRPIFDAIRSAMDNDRQVGFEYVNTHSGISSRVVEPHRLVLKGSNWYLYGFCREKQDFRLFRLSRMRGFSVLDGQFEPREVPEPQLDFESGFAALQTDITLRVSAGIIDRVLDHCPFDRVTCEGEHYLVRYPFIENDYYYDQLLSFGSGCECIAPEHVRAELKRRTRELARVYEG